MTRRVVWISALAVLALAGCNSPGRIVTHRSLADGTVERVEVRQPSKPIAPAILRDGSLQASTGQQDAPDQALAQLSWMPWVGTALIVVGVLSIVGRAWLPFLAVLPLGASWALIAAGGGLLVMPMLLDRYSGLILLSIVAGVALLVAWWVGLFDNIRARMSAYTPTGESKP